MWALAPTGQNLFRHFLKTTKIKIAFPLLITIPPPCVSKPTVVMAYAGYPSIDQYDTIVNFVRFSSQAFVSDPFESHIM